MHTQLSLAWLKHRPLCNVHAGQSAYSQSWHVVNMSCQNKKEQLKEVPFIIYIDTVTHIDVVQTQGGSKCHSLNLEQ